MSVQREPLHVTDDGEVPFRSPVAGVDPVDAAHLVTKGWAEANLGGGGGGLSDGDKGDITVGSSGTTLTIDANAVTDTKLRDSAALSVVGRSTNSSGDPADIAAANDGEVLRRSGTSLGFGTIATAGLANAAVTDAKLRNSAALSVIGRSANSSGAPADIAATAASGAVLRESGSAIAFGTVATAGIADNAITNAKLRDSSALSVVGRSANSTGDPADIAAGTDGHVLRRSGTTLGFGTTATGGIADNAVTDAKLRDAAALSVIGRSANSTGDPADIAAGSDHQVLRRSGTALGFGAVNLAQSAAVTGALPIANGGTGATSAGAALTALGAAAASHTHDGVDVALNNGTWTGPLASARPATVQDLADWIDANWPAP